MCSNRGGGRAAMGATVGTATRERRMAESQATGMTRPGVFCTAAFGKLPSGGGPVSVRPSCPLLGVPKFRIWSHWQLDALRHGVPNMKPHICNVL
jgi:hypothetical protein